jgi:hypothetical protein
MIIKIFFCNVSKLYCIDASCYVIIVKTSFFYFSLYFEGSPQQKIPRELCSGGDPLIFLRSHVPMKRFFDGMD